MDETPPHALQDGSINKNRASLPTRHQVLENEDLLEVVFSYFEPDAFFDGLPNTLNIQHSTRKALLFACLTCRSFVIPASNLLWKIMKSLMPIFKILPTFVKVDDVYTFSGALESAHIQRFEMYARKVRFLCIETLPDNIAGHCIHRLSSIPNFQLLPALRMLHISNLVMSYHHRTFDNFNVLFFIHGHLLTTITIESIDSSNESLVSSILFNLSQKAPMVQDLNLSGRLSLGILGFLNEFRQLQRIRLTFDSMTHRISFLQSFNDLPDLTYLTLVLRDSILDTTTSPIEERIRGFRSLKSLRLDANPGEMVKIFESIDDIQNLDKIMLSSGSTSGIRQLSSSLQACIQESCRLAPNLGIFQLSTGRGIGIPLPSGSLSALVRCKQIVHLELKGLILPITDGHIRELCGSEAWRNLHTLDLPPAIHGQSPSLSILCALAESCPSLITLKIPIDFKLDTPSSLEEARKRQPRRPHCLRSLTIMKTTKNDSDSNSTAQLSIAVARFLEYHFPHLEKHHLKLQSHFQGDHQWWSAVATNIAEFRCIREEVEMERLNIAAS